MAEGIYVRILSVILVYKLVYYFLCVSVMDKQLRVFEVTLHILCISSKAYFFVNDNKLSPKKNFECIA